MDWLDESKPQPTLEDDPACYLFRDYCLSNDTEVAEAYPNFTYPVKYCENRPELTCKTEWLDFETYNGWLAQETDSIYQEACEAFFDFCRLTLITTDPRYVYPLPPPPTVDDYMPGKTNLK